jgi:hypothetical protein
MALSWCLGLHLLKRISWEAGFSPQAFSDLSYVRFQVFFIKSSLGCGGGSPGVF